MGLAGRRGDVRLALLRLLGEGPRNGYQMIQDIEARSRGIWRPSPGSIYPALQQLEDEGLHAAAAGAVAVSWAPGWGAPGPYRTGSGRAFG
ncbi:PadR family transcriptional regulator [Nonomuraea sp. NPDC050536]|uniref:PadR family transcriptional regulator n=1 Tax=Nonomuraea sp. NPDC050536 TaxID=3364366 RepID=UPI0037C82BD8